MWGILIQVILAMTPSTGVSVETRTRICTFEAKPYTWCSGDGRTGFGPLANREIYRCFPNQTSLTRALDSCACDAGVGLFTDQYNATDAILLSTPYANVVPRTYTDTDIDLWTIFTPFEGSLWLLVMTTPLAVAVIMTFFSFVISKYKRKCFRWRVLPQFMFQNMLSLLNDVTHVEYLDWDGKRPYMMILKFFLQSFLVAYAFLCLVIVSVYCAQLTNILFLSNMQPLMERTSMDLEELRTQSIWARVAVPEELVSLIYSNGPGPVGVSFELESSSDAVQMVERVLAHENDAVLLPLEMAIWAVDETAPACSLSIVPMGSLYTYLTARPGGCMPPGFLQQLRPVPGQLSSWMDTYRRAHQAHRTEQCTKQVKTRISISDIAGGWVVLAISIAVPLSMTVGRYLFYLGQKCITEYGHLFVIKTFSSSSDNDSHGSSQKSTPQDDSLA